MYIELPPTLGAMQLDMSLFVVADHVGVMLATLRAVDGVTEGCLPAKAVSTCVMVYVVG